MTALARADAALAEIGDCFALWHGWWQDGSALWLVPALALLAGLGWLLAQVPAATVGRAFATCGGVYVAASPGWMRAVEGMRPDRRDMTCGGGGDGEPDHRQS